MLTIYKSRSSELLANTHSKCTTDSWGKNFYQKLLKNNNVIAFVAGKPPKGLVVLNQIGYEAEILNIAVVRGLQNQGIGKLLLLKVLKLFDGLNVSVITLEVSTYNLFAINLYKDFGFVKVGLRKNYYLKHNGKKEDAYIMKKKL